MVIYIILFVVVALYFLLVVSKKPTKLDLNESHVVITGGSSGIGLEIAKISLLKGATVTLVARNVVKLQNAKKTLEESCATSKVSILSLDVSEDYNEVLEKFEELASKYGPVDFLFNCAGTSCAASFMDLPIEKFSSLMRINYLGSVYCTRAVLASMKSRKKGRIVYVSSQAGQTGVYGYTAYSASKFALRGLAETLHMEVNHLGIGVTISFPPDTQTPGFDEENVDKPEETRLISGDGVVFQPDHVAQCIVSDAVKGNFMSYVGFDGFILGHVTSGMAPTSSSLQCLIQFACMGLFRAISLAYQKSFLGIVKNCYDRRNTKKKN